MSLKKSPPAGKNRRKSAPSPAPPKGPAAGTLHAQTRRQLGLHYANKYGVKRKG